MGLGLEFIRINQFFPSLWSGYGPGSSLPRAPFFLLDFKPCVHFMGNFTRLFLIHFQLKAQNAGFVRALWWFRFMLVHLFFSLLKAHRSLINFAQTFACLIVKKIIGNRREYLASVPKPCTFPRGDWCLSEGELLWKKKGYHWRWAHHWRRKGWLWAQVF